jgi:hypothetical protein
MIPRPVRNNNPGDLESGANWRGLMPAEKLSSEQRAEPRFAVFAAPEWGFRALAMLLHTYQVAHGDGTVEKIITRFAPPLENDTAAYISDIAWALQVAPASLLDLASRARMAALVKAIARHETGGWEPYWQDAQLERGLDLAGFPPYPTSPAASSQAAA